MTDETRSATITHKWICAYCTGKLTSGIDGQAPARECEHPNIHHVACSNCIEGYKWLVQHGLDMPLLCKAGQENGGAE